MLCTKTSCFTIKREMEVEKRVEERVMGDDVQICDFWGKAQPKVDYFT